MQNTFCRFKYFPNEEYAQSESRRDIYFVQINDLPTFLSFHPSSLFVPEASLDLTATHSLGFLDSITPYFRRRTIRLLLSEVSNLKTEDEFFQTWDSLKITVTFLFSARRTAH